MHTFVITIATGLLILISSCSKKAALGQELGGTTTTGETTAATTLSLPDQVTFNAHIRPIFSDKCFACHGFDQKKRESDLRLDTPEGAYAKLKESKGHAIVPGKPEESDVWKRIVTTDPEELMPPDDFHKPISKHERSLIKRWIEQGAEYEEHWAYRPIENPATPKLKKHQDVVANAIDTFILHQNRSSHAKDKRVFLAGF